MSGETAVNTPGQSSSSLDARIAEVSKPQPTPHSSISDEIPGLVGVTSSEYERYERKVVVEKVDYEEFIIDPLEMEYSPPAAPENWTPFTHPEGSVYFQNKELATYPILTDVYVYETSAREELEDYINKILTYINQHEVQLPQGDICLVLEFRKSENCGYYFVNHARRCLFWLAEFDAIDFLAAVKVHYEPSHVAHEMEALYWLHNEYFPSPDIHPMPHKVVTELEDILHHAIGDALTSSSPTMPYPIDVLQQMLALTNSVRQTNQQDRGLGPGSTSMMYRFLHNFHHEYFLHLHGQKTARLDRDQPVHPTYKRTFLMTIFSPLLFYGPEIHSKTLQKTAVDFTVRKADWDAVMAQLTDGWKQLNIYATVMLAANVAFLAIPGIEGMDDASPPGSCSWQQSISYLSTMDSLGSIILGLLLVQLHNTTLKPPIFLAQRSVSSLGLETLALMYSLPYGLLMWGTASFSVAFLIMAFSFRNKPTIVILSICLVAFLLLLGWCISSSFETEPFWYPWPFRKVMPYFDKSKRFKGGLRRKRGEVVAP